MGKEVRTEQEGQELVDAWGASGLSQTAFAQSHGISQHVVSYWKRRLSKSIPAAASTKIIKVSATAGVQQAGIHIQFPSGIRLDIDSPLDLGGLLALVAKL